MHGFYLFENVKEALAKNLKASYRPDFVPLICDSIRYNYAQVLRAHAAGDFYDEEYVDKWQQITSKCRATQFYAYTRSWREETLIPSLTALSQLSNFQLWYSCDKDTGEPPATSKILRAYMSVDDDDKPNYQVDLFFRTKRITVLKRISGVRVCPVENGVKPTKPLQCSNCGLCWDETKLHHLKHPTKDSSNARTLTQTQ